MPDISLAGLNIPDYLKNTLTNAAGTLTSTLGDVASIMTRAGTTSEAEQTAIKDEATAKNDAERLIAARKLKREAENKEEMAQYGTNKDASSYILSAMSGNILSINKELDQRTAKLQEKLDTKFTDDPIGWITNQFTIPGDVLAFTHRASDLERNYGVMKKMLDLSKDTVALNNSIDAGTSMEIAAAVERQNLASAAANVAKSQQALASMNLTGVNIRNATTMNQAHIVIAAQAAQAKEQELQLARGAAWRAERGLQLQEEMKNLMMDEKREKIETRQIIQKKLDNYAAVTNTTPLTVAEFDRYSPQNKVKMEAIMNDPDVDAGRLGANTANALANANSLGWPTSPGVRYVRDKLTNWTATLPTSIPAGQTPWEKLKPAEQLVKEQAFIEAKVKEEAKNIPKEGGIYSPPSLLKVLEIPLVQKLSIAKDLSVVAGLDHRAPTDAKQVMQIAIDKVSRGEASPALMAAEISSMYTMIRVDNNTQRAYSRMVIPDLKDFKTAVSMSGILRGRSEVLDMTNTAQLENAILRESVAQGRIKNTTVTGEVSP